MKKPFLIIALLFFAQITHAQDSSNPVRHGTGAPASCIKGKLYVRDSNGHLYTSNNGTCLDISAASGDVVGAASSTDSELPLFSGTGGKTLKRSNSLSGIVLLTSGVVTTLSSTGTGNVVRSTSPAITTPIGIVKGDVGLPLADNTSDASKPVSTAQQAALDLKQNLLTNSAGLRGALSDESGTGAAVFAGGNVGAATATSINGLTITLTTGTVTISNGKTFNVGNSLTINGTDGSTLNVGTGGTLGSNAFNSTAYVPTSTTVNGHALSSNVTVTASDVGLGNATNTSDANKPVSTAQQTALDLKEAIASIPLDTVARLATVDLVDLNTTSATTLYTCPTGKSCIIHRVVVYNASVSLTTASYAFGWTSPNFNDIIANATHVELTGPTLFSILNTKTGALIGVAGGTFKIKPTIAQGSAATVSIQVFGTIY
jgi:hypothetical protein